MTIDPLTETGSENLYAFCRNVATLWTDVLGMVGDAGDTFFSGSAMDFQLSSYVDVSFKTMPLNGDYAERITIQFVARFTPPKEITVFPIGGKGRNAIGGFNNMFVPYNSADVPQEVWGSRILSLERELGLASSLIRIIHMEIKSSDMGILCIVKRRMILLIHLYTKMTTCIILGALR